MFYPLTRVSCVRDDGTITDTDVIRPEIVAKWSASWETLPTIRSGLGFAWHETREAPAFSAGPPFRVLAHTLAQPFFRLATFGLSV